MAGLEHDTAVRCSWTMLRSSSPAPGCIMALRRSSPASSKTAAVVAQRLPARSSAWPSPLCSSSSAGWEWERAGFGGRGEWRVAEGILMERGEGLRDSADWKEEDNSLGRERKGISPMDIGRSHGGRVGREGRGLFLQILVGLNKVFSIICCAPRCRFILTMLIYTGTNFTVKIDALAFPLCNV